MHDPDVCGIAAYAVDLCPGCVQLKRSAADRNDFELYCQREEERRKEEEKKRNNRRTEARNKMRDRR